MRAVRASETPDASFSASVVRKRAVAPLLAPHLEPAAREPGGCQGVGLIREKGMCAAEDTMEEPRVVTGIMLTQGSAQGLWKGSCGRMGREGQRPVKGTDPGQHVVPR